MAINKKAGAEWSLRLSLAVMYLYSGTDIVRHPTSWHWAINGLPQWIKGMIDSVGIDTYLRVQGVGEILFALILLLWFMPKIVVKAVGLLTALEMAAILLFVGIDAITFRDIGLGGAGLAVFFISEGKTY